MARLYNLARMSTSTTGTGTLTLGSAVAGFLSFSGAGISDGETVTYAIEDGVSSEIGRGVYTASGTTLTRNVLKSTNSNSAINLSGSAQVFITVSAEDVCFPPPLNTLISISATVSGSALTIALKTSAGSDASAASPIDIAFPSSTEATNAPVLSKVTGALSLVVPSGATMGFSSATAGRIWVVLFNDAGTPRIGATNCLSGKSIYPLGVHPIASSTAISTSADNAQVFYTDSAVTSKAYVVLGFLEWTSAANTTAGTWASAPTRSKLFLPEVPLPGRRFNTQINTYTSTITTTSTSYTSTGITVAIAPTSVVNLVEVGCACAGDNDTLNNTLFLDVDRGATSLCGVYGRDALSSAVKATSGAGTTPQSFKITDAPATTSSTTYTLKWKVTAGTGTLGARNGSTNTCVTTFYVEEIQV